LGEVQEQLANYAQLKQLTEEWVELSLQMARLMRTGSALAVSRRPTKSRGKTTKRSPRRPG
jgi:hypothetical protein